MICEINVNQTMPNDMVTCSIDEPILLLHIMLHGAHTHYSSEFIYNYTRGWADGAFNIEIFEISHII